MASECSAPVDNSAGCYLVECNNGMCSSTLRHDSTTWAVTPVLSPEIRVGDNGVPMRVAWDGENFLVAMYLNQSTGYARRVSPSGQILDTPAFTLPANLYDLKWIGDRYFVTTNEAGSGEPSNPPAYSHVAMTTMSRTGGILTAKEPLVTEEGLTCAVGGAVGGSIAYSGGALIVMATYQYCSGVLWKIVTSPGLQVQGAGALGDQSHKPRYPSPAPRPGGGFTVLMTDIAIGGGLTEAHVASIEPNGTLAQYRNVDPAPGDGFCCSSSLTLIYGTRTYLMSFQRYGQSYEVLSPSLLTGDEEMPPKPHVEVPGGWAPIQGPEMGFDGTNFLAVTTAGDQVIPGVRFNEDGLLLDPVPFPITPAMDGFESSPRLGSDGRGRYLLAYSKADGNVYVRLFSTCP